MMIVSNTSPIFYLSSINHLDLLHQIYGKIKANRLIIDERLGRQKALQLGISVIGVLGILIAAKQRNLIYTVKPLLHQLTEQTGFWLNSQLYREILQIVGEDS